MPRERELGTKRMNVTQSNLPRNPTLFLGLNRDAEGAASDGELQDFVYNVDSKPNGKLSELEKLEIERIYRTYFG